MVDNFEYRVHDAVDVNNPNLTNVVYMLDIIDACENCSHFDARKSKTHDCFNHGTCIAATLHPKLVNNILDWLE